MASILSVAQASSHTLIVEWDGSHIKFENHAMMLYHGPVEIEPRARKAPDRKNLVVDCVFEDQRTKCWKVKSVATKEWVPYGIDLEYVRPIAILPEFFAEAENATTKGEFTSSPPNDLDSADTEIDDWSERAKNKDYVSSLPEFVIRPLDESEVSQLTERYEILGTATESQTFSIATETIGGEYALGLWKGQIGKRPQRICDEVGDYCAVVLPAKYDHKAAIAYCAIMNSAIGLGTPFYCNVVAYKQGQRWWIFSYGSPEQCDGCGAGGGASCSFFTAVGKEKVVLAVVAALKDGRTNIELKSISESADGTITLAGRNVAVPSKFYSGYYDKSYAVYKVSSSPSKGGAVYTVDGLFNLLISVEPSKKGIDYREIGKSSEDDDLFWFQEQVHDVLRTGLKRTLSVEPSCETISLLPL